MCLDSWSDALETARYLLGSGAVDKALNAVAKALLDAKIDGLEEAIGQVAQGGKRGQTLASIEETLRVRRNQLQACCS